MSRNSNKSGLVERDPALTSAAWTFRSYLRGRGLRFTAQRRAVLEGVMAREGHFDAEQLHDALGQDVSLATVYRTLSLLQEAGLIREVIQEADRARYEAVYGHAHHDHMICVRCGKVIEFCDERIEDLQRSICREHSFRALDHRMGIRGVCRQCREGVTREQ